MASAIALLVVTVIICGFINPSTTNPTPEVDLKKYIHWMKEDLMVNHYFLYSHVLEEEALTNQAAVETVDSLYNNMNSSLSSILAFQTKEFQTAQLFMNETVAEGCIHGLSNYLNEAVKEAMVLYTDCACDAKSKLSRLSKVLSSFNSTYWAAYKRTLNGVQECARSFHNKDSYHRLRPCVEAMENNFIKEYNIKLLLVPSPSMKYFKSTVVDCASRAAEVVTQRGNEFLELLLKCSKVNIDGDPMYNELNLKGWKKHNINIHEQILNANKLYKIHMTTAEDAWSMFSNLKKIALYENVVEKRGVSFYKERQYDYLNDYYNTVMATSLDNPDDSNCTTVATLALDTAVSTSAKGSAECYAEIVKNASTIIENVRESLKYLNSILPYTAHVALLKCFSQGYIFAPETIINCFKITSTTVYIDCIDHITEVKRQFSILEEYQNHFQAGSYMPCGGTSLERLYLEGERTLYELQRCLYIHSGTTYTVTTQNSLVFNTTTGIMKIPSPSTIRYSEDSK